jgi:hypothetical protein
MTRVLVVPVDWSEPLRVAEIEPTLENFKAALDGGWLEAFGVAGEWSAYCDEEGKMKRLPENVRADALARHIGWAPFPGDFLAGPVVFMGPPSGGYEGDGPASVVQTARELFDVMEA